ncbi:MAG: AraC family transcriptional regulator [Spirochaetota bacterium]
MKQPVPGNITILSVHNPNEERALGPAPTPSRERNFRRIYTDRLFVPHIVSIGQGKRTDAALTIRHQIHPGAIELYYIANGVFDIRIGDTAHIVKGGDIISVPPDTWHEGGVLPLQKPHFYWCIIRIPKKGERFLGLSRTETHRLFSALTASRVRPLAIGNGSKSMFDAMLASLIGRDPLCGAIVSRHVLAMLLDTIACGKVKPSRDDMRTALRIDLIRRYVLHHMNELISAEALSETSGLSPATLRREFKKSTGMPLHDYIIREKIRKAEYALRNGTSAVTDIAYDLGFSSPAHFSTVFRKWTGITPQAFRERIKR